jgi:Skp family chaperone for outer membrane proteins
MRMNIWSAGGAVAVAALAMGSGYYLGRHDPAEAQAAASPQAVASSAGAPSVYANAAVGKAATARYRDLAAGLRGRLAPQQQAIQNDARTLEAARTTLPPDKLQQQTQTLAARLRALQAQNAAYTKALEATRVKALRRIAVWANPIIADVYKARHCGALFSRDAMLAGNPAMDLTADVVKGLDASVTTIAFDLERLPDDAASTPTPVTRQ